jgi:hypothetical protein
MFGYAFGRDRSIVDMVGGIPETISDPEVGFWMRQRFDKSWIPGEATRTVNVIVVGRTRKKTLQGTVFHKPANAGAK